MEAASGKELKWFFDQWVYKAGHPELKVRWRYEDADKTVRVVIQQTQKLDDQTPLFRLPTTVEITEAAGKTRLIPVVIDGASHEFVIPAAAKPKMVQLDPEGWLIKELDFEKTVEENRFQLEQAACVLGRLEAARALAKVAKDQTEAARALACSWKQERAVDAKREMVELLCTGEETLHAALLEAAAAPEARVRVAALGGLAKLKRDDAAEAVLRTAWTNRKEAYGVRKAALRGLVAWKVKDADDLLAAALKMPDGQHTLAATALAILMETPGTKARELAALYSRHGQPAALRSEAIGSFVRLAKDDPPLQDILLTLVDDPDRMLRFRIWESVRALKLTRAYPALKARLERESIGFSGFARRQLQETLEALKDGDPADAGRTDPARGIAELENQAAELELKTKELRSRIAALKRKAEPEGPPSKATASGTGSAH
jgi:aminopeptidase N